MGIYSMISAKSAILASVVSIPAMLVCAFPASAQVDRSGLSEAVTIKYEDFDYAPGDAEGLSGNSASVGVDVAYTWQFDSRDGNVSALIEVELGASASDLKNRALVYSCHGASCGGDEYDGHFSIESSWSLEANLHFGVASGPWAVTLFGGPRARDMTTEWEWTYPGHPSWNSTNGEEKVVGGFGYGVSGTLEIAPNLALDARVGRDEYTASKFTFGDGDSYERKLKSTVARLSLVLRN
jgi:hypothetical protein